MERLYIIKAENAGNLTVSLTFSDNTVQTVDIGEFFDKRSGKAERRMKREPAPDEIVDFDALTTDELSQHIRSVIIRERSRLQGCDKL